MNAADEVVDAKEEAENDNIDEEGWMDVDVDVRQPTCGRISAQCRK